MAKPRVYFGRLPHGTSALEIEKLVHGYGFIRDLTAHGTYAFVEFDKMRDAERTIARLHGINFNGKKIVVEIAKNGNRNRSPIRRRSITPPYVARRQSSFRLRTRNHRPVLSRSRSPIFRHRHVQTPSPPPALVVRPRKLSLGSLEDGEIRSSLSSTSIVVSANVRKLKTIPDSDENSAMSQRESALLDTSKNVNQKKDESLSTRSETPLVSPRHTSPSTDGSSTPRDGVKASPPRQLSFSALENKVEVTKGLAESVDHAQDVNAEFLHDYFEDVGFEDPPIRAAKTKLPNAISNKATFTQASFNTDTGFSLNPAKNVPVFRHKTAQASRILSPSVFNGISPIQPNLVLTTGQISSRSSSEYNLNKELELSDSDSDLDHSQLPYSQNKFDDDNKSNSSSSSGSSSSSSLSRSNIHDNDF